MEEDRNEAQRLVAHERSARALQEDLMNSHLHKQQEFEEKHLRNISKSNEVMFKLLRLAFDQLNHITVDELVCFWPNDKNI